MANNTAREIQKAAIALFKEKGYHCVTIDDILKASGVTKGTFYYHFPSKDSLLYDFFVVAKTISPEATRLLITSDNNWQKMWACLEPTIDWAIMAGSDIVSQVLVLNVRSQVDSLSVSKDPEIAGIYMDIIEKGQETDQFQNRSDPREIYIDLKYVSLGLVTEWCICGGQFDYKSAFRNSVATLLSVREEFL